MNKEAKAWLVYSALVLVVIIVSIVLVNAVITFSESDPLSSYRLVTEPLAGRAYTPFPFTEAHLPYCITPSNSLSSAIPVTKNEITQILNFPIGMDQSILKEIGVDYLTTETYSVDVPVYGTCQQELLNNETGQNEPYSVGCITGYTQESKTRQVWKPLKDISQLNLEAGKEQCFDIWGTLEPRIKSNFAVDVIPNLKLQNKEIALSEFAWWNQSISYKREHVGNYVYNQSMQKVPCLINASWGFGDGTVTNYVWGKCASNKTFVYYNNMSQFFLVDGNETTQLAMQTEGKENSYNYNPASIWDNFSLVILPNESISNSTGSVTSMGQYSKRVNFTTNCVRGEGSAVTSKINISSSYIRAGINSPGAGCSGLRTGNSSLFNCNKCTFLTTFQYPGYSAQNGDFLTYWNPAGQIRRFQLIAGNDIDSAASGSGPCTWQANFTTGSHYCLGIVVDGAANVSAYVLAANGSKYWLNTCGQALYNFTNMDGMYFGGNPTDSSKSFNGTWDFIGLMNISASRSYVERFCDEILLNASSFAAQQAGNALEIEADSAIQDGIYLALSNYSYSNYTEQQIYTRNLSNSQTIGKFDVVALSGNQRWAFNYVSVNENTSNATGIVNITPVLYVWESSNKTAVNITDEVKSFIINTKI